MILQWSGCRNHESVDVPDRKVEDLNWADNFPVEPPQFESFVSEGFPALIRCEPVKAESIQSALKELLLNRSY